MDERGEGEEGQEGSDGAPCIVTPSYLDRLCLSINSEFKFVICQICREAVQNDETQSHLCNKHVELLAVFQQSLFLDALLKLGLDPTAELPRNISGPRRPLHGLPVIHDTYACPHTGCTTILANKHSARGHHHRHHKGTSLPLSGWRTCRAQWLKTKGPGNHQMLWEVMAEDDTRSSGTLVQQLKRELADELEASRAHTHQP